MTSRQIRVAQQTLAAEGLLMIGCSATDHQVIRMTKLALGGRAARSSFAALTTLMCLYDK